MNHECLFCFEPEEECRCSDCELVTKVTLLNFFTDVIKEFAPRKARNITLYDGVDFVNEWCEKLHDPDMKKD